MSGVQPSPWDGVSARYQERHALPTHSAHYGPFAPLESELRLLGDVRGLRILDVGCGGGQSAIAFARQGAHAAGCDPSAAQLAFARALAAAEGVALPLTQASAEDLSAYARGAWDVIFCVQVLSYVAPIEAALAECARLLRPGGTLIVSVDHPLRDCFFDAADEEMTPYPSRDYADATPRRWRFVDTEVTLTTYPRTLARWVDLLVGAGFAIRRLLEPEPPAALLDDLWPLDSPLAPLRHLPHTLIFVCRTP